jgi:hypothetical protein
MEKVQDMAEMELILVKLNKILRLLIIVQMMINYILKICSQNICLILFKKLFKKTVKPKV